MSLPLRTRIEYTIPGNLHQLHSVPPPEHKDGLEYTIPGNLHQLHSVPPPEHKDSLEYTIPGNLHQLHSVPPPQHKDGLEYSIPDNLHQLHSVPPPQHKDGLEYMEVHSNHLQHPIVHPHPSAWFIDKMMMSIFTILLCTKGIWIGRYSLTFTVLWDCFYYLTKNISLTKDINHLFVFVDLLR